jgi:hypothetical protein
MTPDPDSSTLRQRLEAFFTPELAASLAREPAAWPPALRKARPEFVLALVRDDDPADAINRLGTVVNLAISANGIIEAIAGSLAVVTFGSVGNTEPRAELEERRRSLVAELRGALRDDVALLHGSGEALVGSIGGGQHLHFGSLFGHFSALIRAACALRWGETAEWQSEPSQDEPSY